MDSIEAVGRRRLTAEEWQKHFAERDGSGKRVIEYCREHGLTVHKYYYWRKRLQDGTPGGPHGGFVECRIKATSGALILECGNGYRVHIGSGFDGKTLEQVLGVLERC